MAKSKSKGDKPSTAQSTLNAFQQELTKILNGLQTQITTDASNESTALNKFIQAESSLVAKSTEFGGPSPYFVTPTWLGSTKPNGAKSYKDAFTPIIKLVLSQKTAAQGEQQINQEELSVNLSNVFKTVFNRLGIKKGMSSSNQQTSIQWVQDSIFESHAYLSVTDQEGLANQMVGAVLKGTGLPSEGVYGNATDKKSYNYFVNTQISDYLESIKGDGPDIEYLTNQILKLLKGTLSKYNQSDEDSIREWVQVTISTAPSTIAITNLQKDELVGALEQEISKLFPQPDDSFFFNNLQTTLYQNIYNPPPSTLMSNKVAGVAPPREICVLIKNTVNTTGSTGKIIAEALGGDLSPGNNYQFTWTNTATKQDLASTTDTIKNLAPGEYQVTVTDGKNVSAPVKVSIYNSNLALTEKNYSNVSLNGGSNGMITVSATGGSGKYTFKWTNVDTKVSPSSTTSLDGKSSTATKLKAGTYSVVVTDGKKSEATLLLVITEPAYSQNNGMKFLIEKIMGISDNTKASADQKKIASQLENAFKEVVKVAISKTFNDLPEYGAQGQLMSSTYDYQMINRISDYTTALVQELKTDYNTFIPTNSSNALAAAQEITAAAVSFREFAMSLPALTDAFKSELNHSTTGNSSNSAFVSNNYTTIKNLIDNDPNTSLTNLSKLADAVYLSTNRNKVPLIKIAELDGVTLASSTAGLNTSLNKLLTGEQSAAMNSLENMKKNAQANFDAAYRNFNTKAVGYFSEMDSYIVAKQDFNYDMLKLEAVNNALNTLTQVIETGISHSSFTDVYAKT